MTFDPVPPIEELLARISELLRNGIVGSPEFTGDNPWNTESDPCPADHWAFPEGMRLYRSLKPELMHPPALEILTDDPVSVNAGQHLYGVHTEINCHWQRDLPCEEGWRAVSYAARCLINAITLPGPPPVAQTAQARLSTANLHVWGQRDLDNFLERDFRELTAIEGHPIYSFSCIILCSRRLT